MNLQLNVLHPSFDILQKQYGDDGLDSIYGAGCISRPDICFIFMNPTGKNVSSSLSWTGLKAPWIGTKNVWKLFFEIGLLSKETLSRILLKRPEDWDISFSEEIYQEIAEKKIYVTNLGKCTRRDSVPISDKVFKEYLGLLDQEISLVRPKTIITFGNQVSSLFLRAKIQVSQMRRQSFSRVIDHQIYQVFPTFYPVGQGMRNLPLAIDDIKFVLNETRAM